MEDAGRRTDNEACIFLRLQLLADIGDFLLKRLSSVLHWVNSHFLTGTGRAILAPDQVDQVLLNPN